MTTDLGDDEHSDDNDGELDEDEQRQARLEAALERAEQHPIPPDLRKAIAGEVEPQTMHAETDHGDVMTCIAIAYPLIRDWLEAAADDRADKALGGFAELGKAVRELSGPDAWDEAAVEQRLEVVIREVPKLLNVARAVERQPVTIHFQSQPRESTVAEYLARTARTATR